MKEELREMTERCKSEEIQRQDFPSSHCSLENLATNARFPYSHSSGG